MLNELQKDLLTEFVNVYVGQAASMRCIKHSYCPRISRMKISASRICM